MSTRRPPLPPFNLETAIERVRLAYEWHDDSGNWFRS